MIISFYREDLSSKLSRKEVVLEIGEAVLDYSPERSEEELTLFPLIDLSPTAKFDYNRFSQDPGAATYVKYPVDLDDSNFGNTIFEWQRASEEPENKDYYNTIYDYFQGSAVYVAEYNSPTPLSGYLESVAREEANLIADLELEKRLERVGSYVLSAAKSGHNLSSKMDSYRNVLYGLREDYNYPIAYALELERGTSALWPVEPSHDSAFDTSNLTLPIDAYTKAEAKQQLVQVYASWNGSNAGSYDWANDQLSSFGVDSVSRIQEGSFRVYFSEAFTDSNYTVTTGVGAENYGGSGASPRQLTVIRSEMTPNYVTVHCERTDDAVDEDNEYMSVIVMGTQ